MEFHGNLWWISANHVGMATWRQSNLMLGNLLPSPVQRVLLVTCDGVFWLREPSFPGQAPAGSQHPWAVWQAVSWH